MRASRGWNHRDLEPAFRHKPELVALDTEVIGHYVSMGITAASITDIPRWICGFFPCVRLCTGNFFGKVQAIHAGPTLRFPDEHLGVFSNLTASDNATHYAARAKVTHQGASFHACNANHIL